ncbi:hypothetical protein [Sphingomonas sp.]|jgi:hypothetical protein|uniref:hypothetical protein n=1 Tax=Sphingomonas sp. TaxID=28214 RepID=UPI0017D58886|nr:hypothetical protein [Sphingomonas sp.]MBA4760883.1 hypothetical protein [Sphingomonas sp.]
MKIKPQRSSGDGNGGGGKAPADGDNGNPPNRGVIAVGVLRSTGQQIVVRKR